LRLFQYRALDRHTLPFDPAPADSAVLNVNSASSRALERLEGIGPELAARIIEERNRGGPFADAGDLAARVRGIGQLTIERLARQLYFRDSAPQEQ